MPPKDYRDLVEGALFNHFENNRELTTKVGLPNSIVYYTIV